MDHLGADRGRDQPVHKIGLPARQLVDADYLGCRSGGPVLNAAGQVVGVVVAKLDIAYALKAYHDIPQNVNFARRGEIVKLFLAQNGVDPVIATAVPALAPESLAELAQGYTRLIVCN